MSKITEDFLCQALETELGGVQVYLTAIQCAQNEDLKEEWEKYLDETRDHVTVYTDLMTELGMDPEMETPGRAIVRFKGKNLVKTMEMALAKAEPEEAEIVAAECIVEAETKCHLNWQLVGALSKENNAHAKHLKAAYDEVEDQEDEHLYHTAGWARELWIQHLGMPAVLPPPEEEKNVKTAIGASRAKSARKEML